MRIFAAWFFLLIFAFVGSPTIAKTFPRVTPVPPFDPRHPVKHSLQTRSKVKPHQGPHTPHKPVTALGTISASVVQSSDSGGQGGYHVTDNTVTGIYANTSAYDANAFTLNSRTSATFNYTRFETCVISSP